PASPVRSEQVSSFADRDRDIDHFELPAQQLLDFSVEEGPGPAEGAGSEVQRGFVAFPWGQLYHLCRAVFCLSPRDSAGSSVHWHRPGHVSELLAEFLLDVQGRCRLDGARSNDRGN